MQQEKQLNKCPIFCQSANFFFTARRNRKMSTANENEASSVAESSTTDASSFVSHKFDVGPSFRLGVIPQTMDEEFCEEEMESLMLKGPHPFDDLTDNDVVKMIEELKVDTKHLELENLVFEKFLQKNDASLLQGMSTILEMASKLQGQVSYGGSASGISSRRGTDESFASSTRHTESVLKMGTVTATSVGERGVRINISQKVDLVMRETEEVQIALENFLKRSHISKCNMKAELEDIDLSLNEYNEARENFEQVVVIKGLDPLTQRIPAEKFVRYMEEWLRNAEFTIEKMRLRTSTLKGQYTKVCHQLTQKEELGETLHAVDFEQLRIENQHFLDRIEQKNHHLFELKKMNGRANLVLTNQKKYLQKCLQELSMLRNNIHATETKIDLLDNESEECQIEAEQAKRRYEHLKYLCDNYRVPDLMTYVRTKANLDEMKREVKVWARRIGVQKIALNTCTRQMKTMTGLRKACPSWYSLTIERSDSGMSVLDLHDITQHRSSSLFDMDKR